MRKIICVIFATLVVFSTFAQQEIIKPTVNKNTSSTSINSKDTKGIIKSFNYNDGVQRTVLIEEFTSEKCPNCPPVATYLNGLEEKHDNVILMAHHAGYDYDEFEIPESVKMEEFYGGGAYGGGEKYAPAAMFDRHFNGLDNDNWEGEEDAPVFYATSPYGEIRLKDRLAQPAYVNVHMDVTLSTDTKFTATVSGKFLKDFIDDLGVSMWIIEDGIKSTTQAGYEGEWTHHALVRAVVSDRLGTALTTSTNKDDTYTMKFDYEMKNDWKVENLSLVAFVSTLDASDINKRTVLNAGVIKVISTGVNEAALDNTKIYPNPFNNEITISGLENTSQISICNIMGQIMMTINTFENEVVLSTNEMPKGIYFITIKDKNSIIRTEKMVKQ